MEKNESKILLLDRKLMEEKEYWIQKLSQGMGDSNLRLDYQRPADYREEKESVDLHLGGELFQRLNKVTGGGDFLHYTILMAALKVCLHKYTGSARIITGSPQRGQGEGFNVLPIVDDIDPNISFRQFLTNVRQTLLDAYARQQYPYDRLIRDFRLEGMQNRFPLFDVALALTNIHCALPQIRNDITITFTKTTDQVSGKIEYARNLFDGGAIRRFAGHYANVLNDGLEDTNRTISCLRLLGEEERCQILVEWNNTARDYPRDTCFHQLFEAQAEKSPDAVAATFEGSQMTYRELNCRANQFAHYLRARGIGPEVVAAVYTERSFDMLVGVLGILKAGGAYLPLDTDYPEERLAFMLEDSKAPVVVTQGRMAAPLAKILELIPQGARPAVICLDTEWKAISRESSENPASGVTPDNLIYVMYTSGSTGRPKGALNIHRGICNLAAAHVQIFGVQPGSRVLQLSSLSFDAFVSELAMSLCSGATLCLGTMKSLMPGAPLMNQLRKNAITHVTIPPTVLAVLSPDGLPDLRVVIAAGESCPPDIVARWSQGRRFFNAYGLTETSVCVTVAQCEDGGRKPPIGRPLDNVQTYILDRQMNPVPPGVIGELYIGGVCLGRGYLNLPELTEEKFIRNPLLGAQVKGQPLGNYYELSDRLYRTGDQALYLPNGEIEFLGRSDHLVKIRGFRIEPGEIEAALASHPIVRQAVVIDREDQPGNKRLVAYIVEGKDAEAGVRDGGKQGDAKEMDGDIHDALRNYLTKKLPHYMVPSAFVILKSLPLLPNGKVDRKALPVPETAKKGRDGGYVSPRDTVEMQLVQIWEEILDVRPIGVRDNFFDLGGHSLLAVQLMARIEQHFGKKLLLMAIFEGATVEQLAVSLRKHTGPSTWSPLVPIRKGGSKPPLFFIHPGGGTVHGFFELCRYLDPGMPIYGLQARGFEKGQEPVTRIEEMAATYVETLKTVQPEGPYYFVGWCFGARAAYEMAVQLQAQGQGMALLAFLDAYSPSVIPNEPPDLDDAARLLNLISQDVPVTLEHLRGMGREEMLAYVLEQSKRINVLPPDFDLEQGKRFFEVFKANGRMANYPISKTLQGRVTLFRAEEERAFAAGITGDHALAWGSVVAKGVDVHFVPGNHNTLVRQPHARALAEKLNACIRQAREEAAQASSLHE